MNDEKAWSLAHALYIQGCPGPFLFVDDLFVVHNRDNVYSSRGTDWFLKYHLQFTSYQTKPTLGTINLVRQMANCGTMWILTTKLVIVTSNN